MKLQSNKIQYAMVKSTQGCAIELIETLNRKQYEKFVRMLVSIHRSIYCEVIMQIESQFHRNLVNFL